MICCKCMDRLHLSMHLLFLSPSRFQHIFNKDAIARRRLVDQHMGTAPMSLPSCKMGLPDTSDCHYEQHDMFV